MKPFGVFNILQTTEILSKNLFFNNKHLKYRIKVLADLLWIHVCAIYKFYYEKGGKKERRWRELNVSVLAGYRSGLSIPGFILLS